MNTFENIASRISSGENISQYELMPFLCLESKEARLKVNAALALAFYQSGTEQSLSLARVCIKRAWNLSGFAEELLPLLEKILAALNDTQEIKAAYKRIGLKMANSGRIDDAIKYLGLWQNAYGNYDHLDKYEFDHDIIAAMTRITEPLLLPEIQHVNGNSEKKLRLAYIIKGITEVNSVLIKINLLYAKYHDKEIYDVTFFTLDTEEQVINSPQGKVHTDYLRNCDTEICFMKSAESTVDRIIGLAQSIFDFQPDLIITSTALVNFEHYFLTLLLSKSKILSFNQGPPPQFTPPNVAWSIAWTQHPLIDAPVGGSIVPLEFELFNPEEIRQYDRDHFNIPPDSVIIISAGRTQKFQDALFWNAVNTILSNDRNRHFIAIGIEEFYAPAHYRNLPDEIKQRIKFAGWKDDYLRILKMADLVIDTYPNGGGVVIVDAMVFGIPLISFTNNYMMEFDQTNWSPAEEIVDVPDLIIPRGDFDSFINSIEKILQNKEYRHILGQTCKTKVFAARSNPLRMVQRSEEIYRDVINDRMEKSDNSSTAGVLRDLSLKELENKMLFAENFREWKKAFEKGYNSNMGDHSDYFYNKYLEEIGLYNWIAKSRRITEYGPGNAFFMKKFIDQNPDKKFYLCEIAEKVVEELKTGFGKFDNVEILLNYPELENLEKIDLAFSFLLCQSMPKTLWTRHLSNVKKMLSDEGNYIFQFAFYSGGAANDNVSNAVSGSNMYKPEEIYRILECAGFQGCDISGPINLDSFNTEVVWYLCRAY